MTTMADLVLANLQPFGRNRLYTQKEEETLSNNVNNISGIDQYGVLEVPKEASETAIQKAYESKSEELKKSDTPEAKRQLAELDKAHQTLADQNITPDIFYLHILRFSPTTLDDLANAAGESEATPQATTLILNLRDNIGGAIDGLPWFLGPFLGADQPAYQFYHQGQKTDFKTKTGPPASASPQAMRAGWLAPLSGVDRRSQKTSLGFKAPANPGCR